MRYVVDTNVLLDKPEIILDYDVVILSHVNRELEKFKSGIGELSYKARRAVRVLRENKDKVFINFKDYHFNLNNVFDPSYVDNKIIQACYESGYGLITGDFLLQHKAKGFNIEVVDFAENSDMEYKGYHLVTIENEKELAWVYENQHENPYGLLVNQYLIIKNNQDKLTYNNLTAIHRWDGNSLEPLKLPPKKVISSRNPLQEIALDILYNRDIPIKFIGGTFGSGKTLLSVAVGHHYVEEKAKYANMTLVRNPIGSGEEIGFLPGDKSEKTEAFFKPLIQHIGEVEAENMKRNNRLMQEIPWHMKGLDIPNSFIIVDEAEDLNRKTIKLIGTRLAEGSVVAFCGDYKQSEDKYINNNGLLYAMDKLKGNPLVAMIALEEDVRSSASKVFAELD